MVFWFPPQKKTPHKKNGKGFEGGKSTQDAAENVP